jgi:hypothetical protein
MTTQLQPDPAGLDASLVPKTSAGVFACEPCLERDRCRMGILATRMEGQTLWLDIEVPDEYREAGGLAHSSWVGGIMAEICGQLPPFLGVVVFVGTVTLRINSAVPMGLPLLGRVSLDEQQGRKVYVRASLIDEASGVELVTASAITITVQLRNLEDRGQASAPS